VDEVTHFTKAGGGCGQCHDRIEEIIAEVRGELEKTQPRKDVSLPRLTNIQKIAKIQEVIEKEIRPMLQHDGGDIELIDVDGNKVMVALRGMCTSCPSSQVTLNVGIQEKLRELVLPDLVVEEVAG
jgi:NifU-like protein